MIFYLIECLTGSVSKVDVGSEQEAREEALRVARHIESNHGTRHARVIVTRLFEIIEIGDDR